MIEIARAAAAGEEGAELALEVFAHRTAAAVAASAGGIDALVFTAPRPIGGRSDGGR